MVDVSRGSHGRDACLLRFPGSETILIDTGFDHYTRAKLLPFMQEQGVGSIDKIIITHAPLSHYEGALASIDSLD